MTVKQQLIAEIERIDNAVMLAQLYEVMQLLTQTANTPVNSVVSAYAGCLDDESALQMSATVAAEFGNIEGEW